MFKDLRIGTRLASGIGSVLMPACRPSRRRMTSRPRTAAR